MAANLKLEMVISAVDRATDTVKKINSSIDKLTEPARRVRAAFTSLIQEGRFDRIGTSLDRVRERFSGVLGVLGNVTTHLAGVGAAGTGAAFGIARLTEKIDGIDDFSDRVKISAERLQELEYAAEQAGGSGEGLRNALDFLNRNAGQALAGNKELAAAFDDVGISMKRLGKASTGELMDDILKFTSTLADTPKNTKKLAGFAQDVLGRGGKGLTSFLRLGAEGVADLAKEAREAGAIIGGETVAKFGAFNNVLNRTQRVLFSVVSRALEPAIPSFERLLGKLAKWVAANEDVVATRFVEWIEKLEKSLPDVVDGLGELIDKVNEAVDAWGGWGNVLKTIVGFMAVNAVVAVAQLGVAIYGLGAALVASPFGLALIAIGGLVALATAAYLKWDDLKKLFQDLGVIFGAFADRVMKFVLPKFVMEWINRGDKPSGPAPAGGAPTGAKAPAAIPRAGGSDVNVGGTLKVVIDQQGRAKVGELTKAPYSPMDLDVGYTGSLLGTAN